MPRIVQATDEQKSLAMKETESVLRQCGELCKRLEIPPTEIRLAFEIYTERLRVNLFNDADTELENKRMLARST